jgi:hypothetical protein
MPRGGARKGAGRPVGRKDTLPRSPRNPAYHKGFDRLKEMVDSSVEAEYMHSNDEREFKGNSLEFLKATYRCERLPVRLRVYAATKLAEYEAPAVVDMQLDSILENEKLVAEFEKHRRAHAEEHDKKLREWVIDGRLSDSQAQLVRSLWVTENDPIWEPVPLQHGCDTLKITQQGDTDNLSMQQAPSERLSQDRLPNVTDTDVDHPKPSRQNDNSPEAKATETRLPSPWAELAAPPQPGLVVLFCEPHRAFWTGARRYDADEHGELLVERGAIEDIAALQHSGCRTRR